MRALTVILAACGAASIAQGTACTAVAIGNWSAQTTWGTAGTGCSGAAAGGIPGNGDTVTIGYPVTADVNITIGNTPSDTTGAVPTLPVIKITRTTSGTGGSNGQLTVNSGVTLDIKGSVAVTGLLRSFAPIITLQPGSTWQYDNSDTTQNASANSAVYRMYATQAQSLTALTAIGTGWGAGQFITINGRPPSCSGCTGAIFTCEANTVVGCNQSGFKIDMAYIKFNYLGSPTDAYRSMTTSCAEGDTGTGQLFRLLHTQWTSSTGFGSSANFPCHNMEYDVEYITTSNSTSALINGFYQNTPSTTALDAGKNRILRYAYFDTGMYSNSGNTNFAGFATSAGGNGVSYVVFDRQNSNGQLCGSVNALLLSNIDHMLIRQMVNQASGNACGSTSYLLVAVDGGIGNIHSLQTTKMTTGTYTWNMDHVVWQYGEGTGASSDTDAVTARPAGVTGFPSNFTYMLMLPSASSRLPSYADGLYSLVAGSEVHFNHMVWAFGKDAAGTGGIIGTNYIGETDNGVAGTVGMKNSILWNPSSTPFGSPITIHPSSGFCSLLGSNLNNCVANAIDPTQVHNNLVWNYGTFSNRWVSTVTGCSGGGSVVGGACANGCSSCGTPYDYKMTTTVPGANDLWGTVSGPNPQYAPSFLWQAKGLQGAGPREWANIRFGADLNGSGPTASTPSGCVATNTCTQVYFATTFGVFAAANVDDTTSACTDGPTLSPCAAAGLKGRVDDIFAWIYGMWASTNTALKGKADDNDSFTHGDIGAAPVALQCPTAPIGAVPSTNCPFVSSVPRPNAERAN